MKLTRRAARRLQITLATRKAEKETPQFNYDKLFEPLLPIG